MWPSPWSRLVAGAKWNGFVLTDKKEFGGVEYVLRQLILGGKEG